jgi:hypothetical protein
MRQCARLRRDDLWDDRGDGNERGLCDLRPDTLYEMRPGETRRTWIRRRMRSRRDNLYDCRRQESDREACYRLSGVSATVGLHAGEYMFPTPFLPRCPLVPSVFLHRPEYFPAPPTPSGTLRTRPCSSTNTFGLIAHDRIERFPSHYTRES